MIEPQEEPILSKEELDKEIKKAWQDIDSSTKWVDYDNAWKRYDKYKALKAQTK